MENSKEKYPPILEQIHSVSLAARDTLIGFLKTGKVKASSEMQKERMEICLSCPHLTDEFRCSVCGCFSKVKSSLAHEDCPLRKWPHKES